MCSDARLSADAATAFSRRIWPFSGPTPVTYSEMNRVHNALQLRATLSREHGCIDAFSTSVNLSGVNMV